MTRAEHCQSFALVVQALACPRGVCVVTMANYVQLLLKQGKKAEAYTCWLQYRGKVPTDASGGTNMLKEARAFGGHRSGFFFFFFFFVVVLFFYHPLCVLYG